MVSLCVSWSLGVWLSGRRGGGPSSSKPSVVLNCLAIYWYHFFTMTRSNPRYSRFLFLFCTTTHFSLFRESALLLCIMSSPCSWAHHLTALSWFECPDQRLPLKHLNTISTLQRSHLYVQLRCVVSLLQTQQIKVKDLTVCKFVLCPVFWCVLSVSPLSCYSSGHQ